MMKAIETYKVNKEDKKVLLDIVYTSEYAVDSEYMRGRSLVLFDYNCDDEYTRTESTSRELTHMESVVFVNSNNARTLFTKDMIHTFTAKRQDSQDRVKGYWYSDLVKDMHYIARNKDESGYVIDVSTLEMVD